MAVILSFDALRASHGRLILREQIYPACRWARWRDPPAWAPALLRVARTTTGHTGTHQPNLGRDGETAGCEGSVTGHRTSRRTMPETERGRADRSACAHRETLNWDQTHTHTHKTVTMTPSHGFHALSPERGRPCWNQDSFLNTHSSKWS